MHKKSVGSDDPTLGRIIRTWVCSDARRIDSRRFGRGEAWPGVEKDGGAHHESRCAIDLSGGGPKEQIDAKGRSSGDAPMAAGDGGPIPAGKSSSEAWGGVAEVRDEVVDFLAEGIDERRPEIAGAPA